MTQKFMGWNPGKNALASLNSILPFLFSWSHLKAGTVYSSNSSLFHKRSIIGQLNEPAATAANEEQYTLSDIIYFGFQNS